MRSFLLGGLALSLLPVAANATLIGQEVACDLDSAFSPPANEYLECSTTVPQTVGPGAEFQLTWFDVPDWDVDISASSILLSYIYGGGPFQWGGTPDVLLNLNLSWEAPGVVITGVAAISSGIVTDGPGGPAVPDSALDVTFADDSVSVNLSAGNNTNWLVGSWMLIELETAYVSVPEPGTLSLLGVGLLGFGMMRRRRQIS